MCGARLAGAVPGLSPQGQERYRGRRNGAATRPDSPPQILTGRGPTRTAVPGSAAGEKTGLAP